MIRTGLKKIPAVRTLIDTNAWKLVRFRITLLTSQRRNCHYTSFLRLPSQLEALSGAVLDRLLKDGTTKSLKIIVLGCSNGAEVYSIASTLKSRHPDLAFTIYASDIDKDCIKKAKSARYTSQEVFNNELITPEFVNATFDMENDYYLIKDDIKKHVHFEVADALDPRLKERFGTGDIVYAQHFLIHLRPRNAARAFNNACRLLNPRAALFIAGIEHDMLTKLTRKNKLTPLDYKIEEIHSEVCIYGKGWPYVYWGGEPFMTVRKDWRRRYSTIFLKM